jgi:hypothetical protein
MRIGVFLLWISIVALLGLSAFFGIIFNFDPSEAGVVIKIMVYLTLFFGLTGLFSLVSYGGRKIFRKKRNVELDFWMGVITSLIIVGGLVLLTKF